MMVLHTAQSSEHRREPRLFLRMRLPKRRA